MKFDVALTEFDKLAKMCEAVGAIQGVLTQAASAEQAVADSEKRLTAIQQQEQAAKTAIEEAKDQAAKIIERAKGDAKALRDEGQQAIDAAKQEARSLYEVMGEEKAAHENDMRDRESILASVNAEIKAKSADLDGLNKKLADAKAQIAKLLG